MKTLIKIVLLLLMSIEVNAQHSYPDSLKQVLKNVTNDSARFDISVKLATYYQEDKRDSALYYCDKSLSIAKENNLFLDVASSLDNKGYVLMHMGKLPQSLQCFLEAVKLAEDVNNENKTFYKKTKEKARLFRLYVLSNIHHDWGI